ncbi:MAG: T9SS type A sorting domain-containing protein [Crocinitomicaceae bacterium]|nr:T9SS type A sorting domain-containing protein [Crocinitomicaceae bacterium]
MKKIYLSLIVAGFTSTLTLSQNLATPKLLNNFSTDFNPITNSNYNLKNGIEVWSNNFDNPTDWVVDNGGLSDPNYGWDLNGTSEGWYSNGISSTSGGNYAELKNGDPGATPGTQEVLVAYTLTLANAIDIPNLAGNTAGEAVTLQFEETGARFYDNQEVQISTDGGATWTTVRDNSGYSQLTNTGGAPYANPETVQVNLAPFISGNANNVLIRFSWTSEYTTDPNPNAWITYGWYIDDVKLITNNDHDLALLSAYIIGDGNNGMEYGITPQDQISTPWTIGGEVFNNGSNIETNLELSHSIGMNEISSYLTSIDPNATSVMESQTSVALSPNIYTINYNLFADETDADLSNNSLSRTFKISEDWTASTSNIGEYALDGIGVYPNPTTISSIGTGSFADNQDGLVLATMYNIKNTTPLAGIRFMLNNTSQVGGTIYGSLKDTTTFFLEDMSSIANTNEIVITSQDIVAGYVDGYFTSPITLNPGAYYAAGELYSDGGTKTVSLKDDETVAQPFDASVIYIPGGATPGVYTNGVAIGIRLLTGDIGAGLNENTLASVAVYPNPSTGLINVTSLNATANTIVVYDMIGQVVMTKEVNASTTLDLTSSGTGVYLVEVSNENGSFVERVVIK